MPNVDQVDRYILQGIGLDYECYKVLAMRRITYTIPLKEATAGINWGMTKAMGFDGVGIKFTLNLYIRTEEIAWKLQRRIHRRHWAAKEAGVLNFRSWARRTEMNCTNPNETLHLVQLYYIREYWCRTPTFHNLLPGRRASGILQRIMNEKLNEGQFNRQSKSPKIRILQRSRI